MSNLGQTFTTPLINEDRTPRTQKPHWAAGEIIRKITSADELEIVVGKEVRRFRVAVRMGSQGLSLKLTNAGSNKLRNVCAKVAEQYGSSWYEFDYLTQEAVVFAPDQNLPFTEENVNKFKLVEQNG
jgi:hypothetical protein